MPRIDTVIKLATALEIPPGELIEGISWNPAGVTPGEFSINPSQTETISEP
jgi:hypothetical protein